MKESLRTPENFEVRVDAEEAGQIVVLRTPRIKEDVTFTVLAIRESEDAITQVITHLESYLNQIVSIRMGLDTSLQVEFQAAEGQMAKGSEIFVDYDSPVAVQVLRSQEGITYKLVSDKGNDLSSPRRGNTESVPLASSITFTEDTLIRVLAYRASSNNSNLLDAKLFVRVRPNPARIILHPTDSSYYWRRDRPASSSGAITCS